MYGLLGSVFVIAGIWIVTTDHGQRAQIIGWANIIFFGLGVAVFIAQLFNNKPRLILTDEGVEDVSLKMGVIEWQDIVGATVIRISRTAFIALDLVDEDKYLSRLPNFHKKMAGANEAFGFNRINLNLAGLSVEPEQLAEAIIQRASEAQRG